MTNKTFIGLYGQTNKWTHDHSLAVSSGEVISTYIQLERITRRKYDNRIVEYFPHFLESLQISDYEVGYANTFRLDDKFFKLSENNLLSASKDVSFEDPGDDSLWHKEVKGKINGQSHSAIVVSHELAHIFSNVPFYGIFQDNSLLVHIDGAASLGNASIWHYRNGNLELLEVSKDLHKVTMNFSFNDLSLKILNIDRDYHWSMPGKLMGYSSYGKISEELYSWLKKNEFFYSFKKYSPEEIDKYISKIGYNGTTYNQKDQFPKDYAACVQYHFEHEILKLIKSYRDITDAKFLYFSGGAALNIKLNSKLVQSKWFDQVYIPPPAGDSGLSIGVVAYQHWINNLDIPTISVYGNNYGLEPWRYEPNFDLKEIGKILMTNGVIGISTGFAEIGPRALGHRSILALPHKNMYQKVSGDIKNREWYRPIAPVILESQLEEIFIDPIKTPFMQYMLQEYTIKPEKEKDLEAVIHVDKTSRAQVVPDNAEGELKLISQLLEFMIDTYGIPCLINTSFNVAGMPIVHTPEDALKAAKDMNLDAVVINNQLHTLRR